MNRELQHLKVSVTELVAEIQQIRRQHVELDQVAAQNYKKSKNSGVQVKFAKEVINELHGESATDDEIWSRYKAKVGIDETAAVENLSALDRILGPQIQ